MSDEVQADLDQTPDILVLLIARVRAAGVSMSDEQAQQIESGLRNELGGLRTRIPKRRKHPTKEKREEIFQDALGDATDEEITRRHGISRRTLYNYLKRGT